MLDPVEIERGDLIAIRQLLSIVDNIAEAKEALPMLKRIDAALSPEKWDGLEPPTVPVLREMDQHIVLDLYRREGGGLQIAGRDNARGLILSGPTPGGVLAKLWPALHALKNPITKSH